jgi:flagellar M-ring protein FliF
MEAVVQDTPEENRGRWAIFSSLPLVRQLLLMVVGAASIALIVVVVLWTTKPGYTVLFGSLTGKEAGEVMEVLQRLQVPFEINNRTGAVMVPADKLHEVRLQLASEGLPRSAGMGMEFLQQKQEYGTSQFMESSRYQHALEGELARSITSIGAIESARVHLALPKQTSFVRKKEKPTASVLVNLYFGRTLEPQQVAAITHLVASSIPNLEAGSVTVVDQQGRLLSSPQRDGDAALNAEQFEYARKVEDNYIERIENILQPVLGARGFRAQVVADLDFTITEQTNEFFNPDLPALRSEQVLEERTAGGRVQGVPGALSNTPPGTGSAPEQANASGSEQQREINTRRQATSNFELDRTISHSRLASGVIKRLSVAVVVDDKPGVNEEGLPIRVARSEEEMARLTALVREAVGFSANRGDTVNVVNAGFAQLDEQSLVPELPLWQQPWFIELAKLGVAALVILAFMFGVVRPLLRSLATPPGALVVAGEAGAMAAGGEDELAEDRVSIDEAAQATVKLPAPGAYEANLETVRRVVKDDPKLVASVIKSWIASDQK